MVSFADGQGTFINEVIISNNMKFEEREGFLYCDNAILGHTGAQKYYDHEMGGSTNKIVKLNKFREDFLSNESIETVKGKSITRGHPRDSDGKIKFVDSSNFKNLEIGTVYDAWREEDNMRGKLVIKDPDAIIDILAGDLKCLSLGYSAQVVPFGDGEYKQTDFYFNHLATLEGKGRAIKAQIVDEDTVGKENIDMPISKELLEKIKSGEAKVSEDGEFVEFADELHVTHRVKIITQVDTYDDETNESTYETDTHEKETHKHGNPDELKDPYKTGDEETIKEHVGEKTEEELAAEAEALAKGKTEVEKEETKKPEDKEKEEEKIETKIEKKEFGDDMNEQELEKLKADMKADIIAEIKAKQPDVFTDLDPLDKKNQEGNKGFKLDFAKNEELKKELWNRATNPVVHDGNWADLANARKRFL